MYLQIEMKRMIIRTEVKKERKNIVSVWLLLLRQRQRLDSQTATIRQTRQKRERFYFFVVEYKSTTLSHSSAASGANVDK